MDKIWPKFDPLPPSSGQAWTICWPPSPSSCPHSCWMVPKWQARKANFVIQWTIKERNRRISSILVNSWATKLSMLRQDLNKKSKAREFKFLKISILWPLTFYSDPAFKHTVLSSSRIYSNWWNTSVPFFDCSLNDDVCLPCLPFWGHSTTMWTRRGWGGSAKSPCLSTLGQGWRGGGPLECPHGPKFCPGT